MWDSSNNCNELRWTFSIHRNHLSELFEYYQIDERLVNLEADMFDVMRALGL